MDPAIVETAADEVLPGVAAVLDAVMARTLGPEVEVVVAEVAVDAREEVDVDKVGLVNFDSLSS